MRNLMIFGLLVLLFAGCANDIPEENQEPKTTAIKPKQRNAPISTPNQRGKASSHGKVNQVMVVADQEVWDGIAGDTFFYYFAAPYILLPQPEPIFDIIHMTPEELAKRPAKKEFRTIAFLADVTNLNSKTTQLVMADVATSKLQEAQSGEGYKTIVGRDKWANDQLLFYMLAKNEKKLAENISSNFAPVARRINEKDMEIVEATAYQAGVNERLTAEVMDKIGVNVRIPGDFKLAKYNPAKKTIWLRRDVRQAIANIIVHCRPYVSEKQLTKEGIKRIQNEVGKMVTTPRPDTYMRINDVDLPMFVEEKTINGLYTIEAKGIWDIVNDFMGGPFVSYLMLDEAKNELIFVEGFVHAPGRVKASDPSQSNKRDLMQEVEHIISSARLAKQQKNSDSVGSN
jgi:hypothetical protein